MFIHNVAVMPQLKNKTYTYNNINVYIVVVDICLPNWYRNITEVQTMYTWYAINGRHSILGRNMQLHDYHMQ